MDHPPYRRNVGDRHPSFELFIGRFRHNSEVHPKRYRTNICCFVFCSDRFTEFRNAQEYTRGDPSDGGVHHNWCSYQHPTAGRNATHRLFCHPPFGQPSGIHPLCPCLPPIPSGYAHVLPPRVFVYALTLGPSCTGGQRREVTHGRAKENERIELTLMDMRRIKVDLRKVRAAPVHADVRHSP